MATPDWRQGPRGNLDSFAAAKLSIALVTFAWAKSGTKSYSFPSIRWNHFRRSNPLAAHPA